SIFWSASGPGRLLGAASPDRELRGHPANRSSAKPLSPASSGGRCSDTRDAIASPRPASPKAEGHFRQRASRSFRKLLQHELRGQSAPCWYISIPAGRYQRIYQHFGSDTNKSSRTASDDQSSKASVVYWFSGPIRMLLDGNVVPQEGLEPPTP